MAGKPASKRQAARGPGKRLTLADRYRLLTLHKSNPSWTYNQLATESGVNPETARNTCLLADQGAASLMAAYAAPMLRLWTQAARIAASRGDYRPARDWLLHAGSIDPLPETTRGAGTSIVIVNTAMPGMPTGAPVITIEPLTIDAPKALPDDQS